MTKNMDTITRLEPDSWFGCYKKGWAGILVPDAFAHPAKVSFGLAERIYQHVIDEGWLEPGQTVIDPFGGIAGFGFHAMLKGLNFVGVELEPRFVDLGNQNIEKWQKEYGSLPNFGTARLVQGDSRELANVLAQAGACVSSPPYAEARIDGNGDEGASGLRNPDGSFLRGKEGWEKRKEMGQRYGNSDGNLGNLPATNASYQAAISSPPYAESVSKGGEGPGAYGPGNAAFKKTGKYIKGTNTSGSTEYYGDTPGQLGAMRPGDFDAAVSSPPFLAQSGGTNVTADSGPLADKRLLDRHAAGNAAAQGYGDDPGNLGNMAAGDFQAAVSSPPFEDSLDRGTVDKETRIMVARKLGVDASRVSPAEVEKYGGRNQEYGNTAGNIGNSNGDDFWTAARMIVSQVYQVLAPGGAAIWVTKDFVKNKERVPFSDQWRELCESVGFQTVHIHKAWLIEDKGAQYDFEGNLIEKKIKRASFFRRLAEKNGSPPIDWETVLCMRKESR